MSTRNTHSNTHTEAIAVFCNTHSLKLFPAVNTRPDWKLRLFLKRKNTVRGVRDVICHTDLGLRTPSKGAQSLLWFPPAAGGAEVRRAQLPAASPWRHLPGSCFQSKPRVARRRPALARHRRAWPCSESR